MTESELDPFVYPGTNTLKNKFDIRDKDRLSYYEAAFAASRVRELRDKPIEGKLDLDHLKAIHRHIFQDIYPWAGETRENVGAMSKLRPNGQPVSYPIGALAVPYAHKILGNLETHNFYRGLGPDKLADRLGALYGDLDAAHVFREGNSRTLRAFTAEVARTAGYALSWQHMQNRRDELHQARDLAAFGETSAAKPSHALLAGIIREGLTPIVQERSQVREGATAAIRAYDPERRQETPAPLLRGVFQHLDRMKKDIDELVTAPAERSAMFERVKIRVAEQFSNGYSFPTTGANPTKEPARGKTKKRDDDRTR